MKLRGLIGLNEIQRILEHKKKSQNNFPEEPYARCSIWNIRACRALTIL